MRRRPEIHKKNSLTIQYWPKSYSESTKMGFRKIIKDILHENESIVIKNLKKRDFNIDALFEKKTDKIITLTGFRRVGKTHLLFLIKEQLKNESSIYFNFEDERLTESTEVLTELLYAVEELYHNKPVYLFLDEIHIIPDWENSSGESWIKASRYSLPVPALNWD